MPYWRDVGTLDAYYQANMDLIEVDPVLNLYDRELADPHVSAADCRRRSSSSATKARAGHARRGEAHDSMVCHGCIVSRRPRPAQHPVAATCASTATRVVEDSILFDGVDVGRHCRIRRAIIDKDVKIPPDTIIGYDLEHDRHRGFTITEPGIVVVAKAEPPETFQAPNALPN